MKIGTITFHWATNYGAVLQAYALQKYLIQNNCETEIIDYVPIRIKLIQRITWIKELKISEFIKENKINRFRRSCMQLSKVTYFTNNSLKKKCDGYDTYICGSDQVWNESFTLGAEGKPTLSYYLDFVKDGKKRISYATSFGTDKLSEKVINLVKPELEKYNNISVRENSGKDIIENLGLHASTVVDPTLLIEKETYEELIYNQTIKEKYQLFSYILHSNQTIAGEVNDYLFNKYFDINIDKRYNQEPISIFEWIYNLKNSKFVLTNSFHGVVFSLIFHTPFIVILVEGLRMNDRITTLLNSVGLGNRIIDSFNKIKIDELMENSINWENVDCKVQQMRRESIAFIERALKI